MLSAGANLIVLGWHNVRPTWCFPAAPGAGEKGLEQQLKMLRTLANVVPLESALRDLMEGRPLPPRAVAITFDDGYADNLELAGPILRRLGLPATCFLVPGILNGDTSPWWERLAFAFTEATADQLEWKDAIHALPDREQRYSVFKRVAEDLKLVDRHERDAAIDDLTERLAPTGTYDLRSQFLDWDGARKLQEYMTIGSHTMYHAILSRESAQAQHDDLAESRRQLRDRLGADIDVLAYPNGKRVDYTADTIAAAEKAGYAYSITTRNGRTTRDAAPHEIPRWVMNPHRGPVDFAKIVKHLVRSRAA
ncbi:polysaccharide deacetylase family protein [Pseudonocardia sp. H11422]|uniref:polysaccharide deacetylase family protein n=1 Tax=Pseudonocardia sp. H11422 TaxID=2835866 RepID=UPI001BDC12C8|nr:polysaccharide deacetylase family protein [Pseudonocardia sp. H11422]